MRKILCAILVLILCSISIYSFAENTISNNDITELQKQQKELQNQIQDYGEQLTGVQGELTENLEQIQKLDEKITDTEKEIEEFNKKIEKLTKNIKNLDERLKVATDKYNKQKKLLETRLVAMYESGESEYLDVLVSSTSMSDFVSSYFLISEIASYDTQLLNEVDEKKQIIEMANERLSENLEQLSIIKKNKETNSKILQNTKTLRENYISKLSDKEKDIQTKIDEYNTQFSQVNREILEIALSSGMYTDYIGGVMAWPVPGHTLITSPYSMRVHPITGVYKLHTGVDISAPIGADFIATADGVVTKANYNGAYGNMVMIDHGGGISTLYAHGSEILVQVGQVVKRGEPVLKVGSTGYSTGPHAHFEVRINGVPTNPMDYITGNKIPGILDKQEEKLDEETDTTSNNNTTENN
ncbi:MAG: peptidoglycan DD-metalloendopeptidase family protein [Clostridia bacterium]|nr:peptidoglycan DD-metalloendopeptidase family protein [Clostridia bacterium]